MNMNPLRSVLLFLLLSHFLRQSIEARSTAIAFSPRGGGSDSFRQRGRKGRSSSSREVSTESARTQSEVDKVQNDLTNGDSDPPFDREAVIKRVHKEEVAEMKKTQQFLQKQQRRRELDKTWLDKGITAVIEFFENLFRWEVIDV
ncbi:hypothetical protein ACHAWU_006864 [Discostella pseudostelligera]|uniref:Uncharacterized protein n=1 Tax=Discostella pseudostelligera TaxID=259834 RepID=A0ABD3MY66_9STRA